MEGSISQEVVGDSLENFRVIEAVDNPEKVKWHYFDGINLKGDLEVCFVVG